MYRIVVATLLLIGLAGSAWAGGDEAVAAFERGDYTTAKTEWLALARQGDAKAQNSLGGLYDHGRGVARDKVEAVKWYRRAAEQDHARAQLNLGIMYHAGQGVPRDFALAVKWYRKAAAQGFAKAQTSLGVMYENGSGVSRDYALAAEWYRKAADQLFAQALIKLGDMYRKSLGVPRDYVEAYKWFHLAFTLGSREGILGRDWVTAKMTPGQIAEAQKLAKAWAAKHPGK